MRRATLLTGGAAAVVSAGVVALAIGTAGGSRPASAAMRPQVSTAKIERRSLSATVSENGTLTYRAQADGSPYSAINQARGTYTKLPGMGQVVRQGRVLYRVDGNPIVLLHGSTPAYRTLSVGATGADVAELNADLVALGYARKAQLRPSSPSFSAATAVALEKLQTAVGMSPTGALALGRAVFQPTAIRVTALAAPLGGRAQPGQTVLQGTSTARQVQVALSASQQTEVTVGDRVSITLPSNRTTPGVVSSVGKVATCPSASGPGGSSAGATSTATDTCSAGAPGSGSPTVNVDVTPSDPGATGTWDEAAVQVGITTARVPGALVVPVNALLARTRGGYCVEVVDGHGDSHLVPVSLGLFDDSQGLVQVTGAGLAAGQEVVVPA